MAGTAVDGAKGLSRLIRACVARPRAVLVLWLALLVVAGLGVRALEIETSTDSVLDRQDAAWSFYQESLRRFGGDEVVVVALPGRDPFSPELLSDLARLEPELSAIPGVRRVDALTTVPFVESRPDGRLVLDPFVTSREPGDANGQRLRRSLRIDRIAPRTLVSPDGRVVALNVVLERDPPLELDELIRRIEHALADHEAWISGVPIFRTEVNRRTGSEIAVFLVITIAVILTLVMFWFRSMKAAVVALASGGAGSWLVVAAMGATGQPMTLGTMILPSLMLAFGCAYAMHLLVVARGVVDSDLLLERVRRVAVPIGISGLTTAVGFLGIGAVRIDAVRAVGLFGAFGVLVVVAFTITAGTALLALHPIPSPAEGVRERVKRVAGLLTKWAGTRRGPVFAAWILVVLVSLQGIRLMEVETDAVLWFTPGSEVRRDYDAIRRELAGISPVNVVVESTNGRAVTAPETLAAIDALADHLEGLPTVGRAISVADPLRQINGGFQDDSRQLLPASQAAAEQYLLLLESVPQLADLLADDRKAANVQLRVDNNGSRHLLAVAREAERWWAEHGPPGTRARSTGIMFEFARAQEEITRGQIRGLSLALGGIALVFLVVYRSPALVVTALIPNVVPILMIFGVMGWLGVPLDAGTVVIGSLALGIAVDDTVHLITAYRQEKTLGQPGELALERALGSVLVAVSYTTLAIALGFGVLGLSDFTFTRNFGLLTAGVMIVCFLADVLLLPAILVGFRRGRRASSARAA